jgi:pyrroline-5-carboxylate reductase
MEKERVVAGDLKDLTFGFVGTGTITEAVVTGLSKTEFAKNRIVLSPRSEGIARRLADRHENVIIADDNQDVLDRSDLVFLAVRPQIVEDVVKALRFRRGHHVVSFVAATPLEKLSAWIDQPVHLAQAVPLPFVADLQGATAIYPPDETVAAIFSSLGTAVEVASKHEYDLLAAASALMGTYFGVLNVTTEWLAGKGLSNAASGAYLRQLFSGLALTGAAKPDTDFKTLIKEHSTEGGLNEQVLRDFLAGGGGTALSDALERVFARITK